MVIFGNFWYKFAHKEKSWGSIETSKYKCTTTNLPLCNDTIIVLKITLLHSVSRFHKSVTNKNKQTNKQKNHTFSFTAGARRTITTILGTVIEQEWSH